MSEEDTLDDTEDILAVKMARGIGVPQGIQSQQSAARVGLVWLSNWWVFSSRIAV